MTVYIKILELLIKSFAKHNKIHFIFLNDKDFIKLKEELDDKVLEIYTEESINRHLNGRNLGRLHIDNLSFSVCSTEASSFVNPGSKF